jgi:hypothetical protein
MADSQGTADGIAETFPQYLSKVRVVHLGASLPNLRSDFGSLSKLGIYKPYFLQALEPRKNLKTHPSIR